MAKSEKAKSNHSKKTNSTLLIASIALVVLLIGGALWVLWDSSHKAKNANNAQKATTLVAEGTELPAYKDFPFKVDAADLTAAGFAVKKRLMPSFDPELRVKRFLPPTEYFEVALPSDAQDGVTLLNIVGISAKSSGVTDTLTQAQIDDLFTKETADAQYNSVRKLPDGRVKAELASAQCLLQVSGYEKEKVQKLVTILMPKCATLIQAQVVKETSAPSDANQ